MDDGIFHGYLSDQSDAKLDYDDEWSNCEGQLTNPPDSLSQPGPPPEHTQVVMVTTTVHLT